MVLSETPRINAVTLEGAFLDLRKSADGLLNKSDTCRFCSKLRSCVWLIPPDRSCQVGKIDPPGPLPSGNVTRYARFEGQTVKGATSPDRVYLSMSRERSFNLGRFTGNLTQGSKNLRSLAR